MDKPPIKYTESRHIPITIQRYVYWRDGGICVTPDCYETEDLEQDHCPPWNQLIIKCHDPDRIFLRCKCHHSKKSRVDTREAARSKRLALKHTGQYRKSKTPMKSRPFPAGRQIKKMPSRPFPRKY